MARGLPRHLQVDPRAAAPTLARWLADEGVQFVSDTTVLGVESGVLHTNRGEIAADTVIVAVNHEVGHLFPILAERAGIRHCGGST